MLQYRCPQHGPGGMGEGITSIPRVPGEEDKEARAQIQDEPASMGKEDGRQRKERRVSQRKNPKAIEAICLQRSRGRSPYL
jgi:hypothetical protein